MIAHFPFSAVVSQEVQHYQATGFAFHAIPVVEEYLDNLEPWTEEDLTAYSLIIQPAANRY